jgi:TPR repeat protein
MIRPICSDAAYYLGEAYIHDKNYRIAFQYFLAAAKKFHPQSCFATAQAYEKGYDTKKDVRLALQFYKNASLAGFKPAMFRIGIAYLVIKQNVYE